MDLQKQILFESLSHAYVIEGDHEKNLKSVRDLIRSFGIHIAGNPDYTESVYDVYTVDDARELRRVQGLHSAAGDKKIFIITLRTINHEAQNALLKTLEEPTQHTHFFFLVRSSAILLATVLSRVQLVQVSRDEIAHGSEAREFVAASMGERLKKISTLTKAKTDDKSEAKEDARKLLAGLEKILSSKLGDKNIDVAPSLRDIIYAERELSGRAPSLKLLLEHLALTIPRTRDGRVGSSE